MEEEENSKRGRRRRIRTEKGPLSSDSENLG